MCLALLLRVTAVSPKVPVVSSAMPSAADEQFHRSIRVVQNLSGNAIMQGPLSPDLENRLRHYQWGHLPGLRGLI
jgi:hypothetical protein